MKTNLQNLWNKQRKSEQLIPLKENEKKLLELFEETVQNRLNRIQGLQVINSKLCFKTLNINNNNIINNKTPASFFFDAFFDTFNI